MQFLATSRFGAIFSLSLSDLVQRYIFFFGCWEPEISEYISSALGRDDVFIDIGANIGYYSLLAANRVGQIGKVYSIEASPSIFSKLCDNVRRNSADNIVLFNFAVCEEHKMVPIFLHESDNCGATTTIPKIAAKRSATLEGHVEGFPLGDIIPHEDIRRARIIKIDVEGGEWFVLSGLRDLLPALSDSTEILVEVNAAALAYSGVGLATMVELLGAAGFRPFVISYGEDSYLQKRNAPIRPWDAIEFEQADFLFRRSTRAEKS